MASITCLIEGGLLDIGLLFLVLTTIGAIWALFSKKESEADKVSD